MHEFLSISSKISVAPVIHGSGDFAVEVRRLMLNQKFDCLAVPLPASFQEEVERGTDYLPSIGLAVQEEPAEYLGVRDGDNSEMAHRVSYVPIDPCQPVIAALRVALQERMPRRFIDLEVERFEPHAIPLPDPYALKKVSLEKFAAASLPSIPRVPEGQSTDRVRAMAQRLRQLEQEFDSILLVCSLTEWPWIREAYTDQLPCEVAHDEVEETHLLAVDESSLMFMLGELPYLTGLYEEARAELDDDENLSVEGLKRLLLASRDRYKLELKSLARRITPKLLSSYFTYVRNLSLIKSRMTPDLYSLVLAAQQIFGDQFAIELAETVRTYPYPPAVGLSSFRMSLNRGELPDGRICQTVNRLPGHPTTWRSCQLQTKPPKLEREKWKTRWNPFSHCSWPPEDVAIEKFRNHVKDAALSIMGTDLAKTEKFSTSMKDGLDIRETLRNWHSGELYVKVFPPQMGDLDCVLMFFDSPADPRDYPWRVTWQAEHHDESTLALFATAFEEEMVGPGIALAQYGGGMFLFPPRSIVDVWQDQRLDFVDTLEERLLAAACVNAEEKHIAVLSESAPGIGWRRLAKKYGKKLVHVPLGRFSQETVQQLRMVHVLNGHEVRTFASHFIRKP
jgi:hypothetical protein